MKKAGRVLIFTGDGKGKTTAALGMALRASGHGMRTRVVQFIKANSSTGEIAAIRSLPHVEIVQMGLGFVPPASRPEFARHRKAAQDALAHAEDILRSGTYDLVILDEVCGAVAHGLLDEVDVINVITARAEGAIVVLTGRGATEGLMSLADTVTEMRCIKHGLEKGCKAQKGVEL